jgi:hypothetical protein
MKSIKYFILVLTGIFASCDYLDVVPDQIATIDDAFRDRYTAEQALATCYWGLPRLGEYMSNPGHLGVFEMTMNRENIAQPGMQIAMGFQAPNLLPMNYWGSESTGTADPRSLYIGIRDCNTFLENIEKVKDLNRKEKDRLIAEVKTIKAYMHFYLICMFGPIPIQKESIPVSESTSEIRFYRDKIDDCFAYVVELLDEAIALNALPWTITTRATELGRFVEAVPYAIKAKVLVFWASDLFNGNADYSDFYNHEGEHFFNQTKDPSRWVKAAEACKQAIEVCNRSEIRLYKTEDYVHVKRMSDQTLLVNTLRSAFSERWIVEQIWTHTPSWTYSLQDASMPRLSATTAITPGTLSVPFATVELFYSENGVPIEEDKSWVVENGGEKYASRFTSKLGDEAHRYYIQNGERSGAMNFDREPRFYSTLGFDRGKWYGNHEGSVPDDDVNALYPSNRWGEYSSQGSVGAYNITGYWPKKLVGFNSSFMDGGNRFFYTRYPYPEFRIADLMLLAAEALNETKNTPDAEIYGYIDSVRARAGLGGVVESWSNYSTNSAKPLSQDGMREIIRRERRIELACEGHFFWDVRRWKTAVKDLNNRMIQGWNIMSADANTYYTVNTVYVQKFGLRDYFSPVPESDLIKNPNLVQNPGW